MPKVGDCVVALAACEVEDKCLFLPSDFEVKECHQYGLEHLTIKEMKLPEEQAHDALCNLHAIIKYGWTLNQHQKDHVHKQGPMTCVKAIIFDAHLKQSSQEDKYRMAWAAMT